MTNGAQTEHANDFGSTVSSKLFILLERETGIEPATNGLGSRYSTIELLPLRSLLYLSVEIDKRAVSALRG